MPYKSASCVLEAGYAVRLWPEERVPVDGEFITGTSTVDESMLYGESIPVKKRIDVVVFDGIVNANVSMVTRSAAAQIVR